MSGDERIQTPEQTAELLALHRLMAVDSDGQFLFCRHGEHRAAPCSRCRDELGEPDT